MLGQALDQALGDRAGIFRYGHAVVPMDEARAACALDISGRPFLAFEADLPPGGTGNFDHELAEEFFRAVANAREADAARHRRGGHQRPPHDRGGVQGVRPRAARGRRDRPDRDRRALDEGDADLMTRSRSAIVDYGMGNRRSVAEGARARRARPCVLTGDHDALRAADGLVVPGVGAFAAGDGAPARDAASTSSSASARAAGVPVLGACLGHAAAVRALRRARRRPRASACCPARSCRARRRAALKLPHIGWNKVRWTRAVAR